MAEYTIGYYDESVVAGGTTRYLLSLVSSLDRACFKTLLFAFEGRDWHAEAEALGMEVVTLRPLRRPAGPSVMPSTAPPPVTPSLLPWLAGTVREIAGLRRLFSLREVDLLHSNATGAEAAPIAARAARIPIVLGTLHVDSTYDLDNLRGGGNYRLLERMSMRALHHIISVSDATAADWTRRCGLSAAAQRRVTVIPNGADLRKRRRQQSTIATKEKLGLGDRLIIASMGRLEPAKGYTYLIQSLPAIVRQYPKALVRIAGGGPLLEVLRAEAAALGVGAYIEFLGVISNIQELLECADIYVQPSLCEAMPMSILEASAVGIPVVASNVGGVAECVAEGETGYLVPARDPAALGVALLRLLGDSPTRVRMAEAAHRLAEEQFGLDRMVAETEAVYKMLLALPKGMVRKHKRP